MKRVQVARLVVFLVAISTVIAPVAAADASGLSAPAGMNPDAVHLSIDVQPNGTAQWQVEYRVKLTDENETQAYEQLVSDVDNNSTAYVDRFAQRINATVADAESQTGRQMSASDFTVSAEIRQLPQTYGVLTYTFTWSGFAATDGDTVRAGDSLRGFFLDSQTTLQMSWPDDYHATTVRPTPSEQRGTSVTWIGPLDFASGEPQVVIEPGAPTSTTMTPDGSGNAYLLVAGVFIALVALGLFGVWLYRRQDGTGTGPVIDTTGGNGGGAMAPPEPEPAAPPDEELLSNEERVKRFLTEHGGRAKQQEIVEGLEWTEAKTSQVLSDMHDDGAIEKFRIGRENVVKLPDDDQGR